MRGSSLVQATNPRGETRGYTPSPLAGLFLTAGLLFLALASPAPALTDLEQISLKTFEELREVERYQLKVAEKHYTNQDYKVALAEYEKYLTLYETGKGAPYAQLMWSHTMMRLKKPRTAIREGFQSVIDYWPESREAVLAAYCIGNAFKSMGEVSDATRAFRNVIRDYPQHPIAVRAKVDLLHYARLHEDHDERMQILNDLTYKTERTEATKGACVDAAHELARVHFYAQRLEEGKKALATVYKGRKLFDTVYNYSVDTVGHLLRDPKKNSAALKLGEQLLAALRAQTVSDPERAKEMLYRAASLHWKLGRPSDTWRLYEEIGERWGKDDGLLGRMAEWHKARDKRPEARKVYLQFEDRVRGLRNIAEMDLEEGKYKEAMEVFRKLIELDGDNAGDYLWSIANCWERLSDWKKAIATYRQIDRFPDTYFAMAKCHRRLNEFNEAIVLYNQAKVIDRAAPEASLQIGYTYEEAREREKAIRTFQLTCKRYPKSGQAARSHAHLQKKYNINVTLGGAEEE